MQTAEKSTENELKVSRCSEATVERINERCELRATAVEIAASLAVER
jgi:hypothetical protein